MILPTGTRLGPYEVLALLGAGGMGEVYRARDTRLDRTVAIKVLPADLATDPHRRERFHREARAISSLTHPHICVLHDIGEQEGVDFLVMEYLPGETLAHRLLRGALPLDEVLRVAIQLSDALHAAHRQGLMHRDLKPANVMLTGSGAKMLDFGLAKWHGLEQDVTISGAHITAQPTLTQVGGVLGTLQYMAPEQVEGKPVDARADLFALGAIIYEMTTGRKAFEGASATSLIAAILTAVPPPMATLQPVTPPALDRVARKCLDKDPFRRWQTAADLRDELAWIEENLGAHGRAARAEDRAGIVAEAEERVQRPVSWFRRPTRQTVGLVVAAITTLGLAGGYLWRHTANSRELAKTTVAAPAVSLAILPFRNASGDQDLEWLGLAIPEMIRAELGHSPGLRLVSSDRLFQILRDLRVPAAVELDRATISRLSDLSSSDIVVSGQYIRLYTQSGSAIRVDATLAGRNLAGPAVLTVDAPAETDISQAVKTLVRSLRATPALAKIAGTATAAMPEPLSASIPALKAYTEGLQLARQRNDLAALKQFKAATEADPDFALAFAALAQSYSRTGSAGDAAQTARQAVELSGKLPPHQRYLVEGISAAGAKDTDKGIQAYESLAKISPGDSQVIFDLASLYEQKGAFEQARDAFSKVVEQDPKYAEALLAMARVEIRRGHPDAAFDPLNRALAVTNSTENLQARADSLQAIGIVYKRIGRPAQALRCYQDSLEIKRKLGAKRGMANSLIEIAQVQGTLGNLREAEHSNRDALALLREIGDKSAVANGLINLAAHLDDTLGRPDDAVPLLREALQISGSGLL